MPVTVVYLQDHEGKKQGERTRMSVPLFVRLFRAGIVKRVPTLVADIKKANDKRGKNPASVANLKKPAAKKPAKK
jgi:hypothetical protein